MADEYTLLESSAEHKMDPVYTSKQWAYQIDQNQGAYQSKQITFDLSGFFNSSRFLNPQEMFIALPVCVTLSALAAPGAGAGTADGLGCQPTTCDQIPGSNMAQVTDQFAFGLKSGYWNLINSLQIQVDGKDVIQMVPNINYHASFVANTTFSQSDVEKHGPILGFLPDDSESWKLFASAAADGDDGCSRYGFGVTNNSLPPGGSNQVAAFPLDADQVQPVTFAESETGAVNEAFLKRMKWTNKYNKSQFVTPDTEVYQNAHSSTIAHRTAPDATLLSTCMEPTLVSEPMTVRARPAYPAAGNTTPYFVAEPAGPGQYKEDTSSQSSFRELVLTAVIRMKDICNLFGQLPLTRGLYVRMIVQVNTGYVKIPAMGDLAATSFGANAYITEDQVANSALHAPQYIPGPSPVAGATARFENTFVSTCPIMVAPLVASFKQRQTTTVETTAGNVQRINYDTVANSVYSLARYPGMARDMGSKANQGIVLSVEIAKPSSIHAQLGLLNAGAILKDHPLQASRMYVPVIDLDPIQTSRYLSEHKVQSIFYKDVLAYVLPNQMAGDNINYQLGNGIVNAQKLIIMPFYHDDTVVTAGASVGKIMFEPISPFDSAPATCAPRSCLTNFNVLISNINVFQRNIDYSFENFIEEMSLTNAINGGLDTGLTSGLIDYAKWKDNYRYYVVDLSRRIQGDNTPKSITVVGRNSSEYKVDYYFFVEYRRHLEINVETGHVAVSSN